MSDDAPQLRASDADRERVAEILRDALAEGRLDMEEFEERLETTYTARTYAELAPVTRDLPAPGVAPPPSSLSLRKSPGDGGSWADRFVTRDDPGSSGTAIGVLSGFQRRGRWTVPRRMTCFAFWGGGELDLREANFADREVVVTCVTIMGGVHVIVPPGVEVVVRGIGLMGGFDQRESGVAGDPGAPRVIIKGFAFWGGVGVDRKVTKGERQRLKEERRQERLEREQERRELRGAAREDARDRQAADDARAAGAHEAHRSEERGDR
ncbi:DUF1707 domain-containing protein [Streptomyces sp. NPDC005925]|uniref:DUF1707 SHOCT-like domain-containing protein n=1 Tax=Streptomyces sp. NPDC005925 TaxID=3157172 RepID=UPI0033F084E4